MNPDLTVIHKKLCNLIVNPTKNTFCYNLYVAF